MEERHPAVSVVIPCYNCEKYIRITIESVLHQTMKDFEIIVVDDCSTDRSYEIVREMASEDPRIRVLKNEANQGVAAARNKGIEAAEGEKIALLDSDDLWLEDKLERQLDLSRRTGAEIIYCSYDLIDERGNQVRKPFIVPPTADFNYMLASCVISCSTAMVDADLLKAHPFRKAQFNEDYALWLELLSIPVRACGDVKVLAQYRIMQKKSRSSNKWKVAAGRWRIYREVGGLSVLQSMGAFCKYIYYAVKKYYA